MSAGRAASAGAVWLYGGLSVSLSCARSPQFGTPLGTRNYASPVPFHIGIPPYGRTEALGFYEVNLDETTLLRKFVEPYRAGEVITGRGDGSSRTRLPPSPSLRPTTASLRQRERAAGTGQRFHVFAIQGRNRTNEYIAGPPGYERPAQPQPTQEEAQRLRDPRRVMLVHGRNQRALDAMRAFLASLGLVPILWEDAVEETGTASPHNLDAVAAAMGLAQAVIVVFTAEDEARLIERFLLEGEAPEELRGQPRANVFLEAGTALALDRERTILTRLGSFRGASDIDGLNAVVLNNGVGPRSALRRRLQTAGCAVNDRQDYLEPGVAGDFEAAVA
jgi:predicted nucleotide-binding protein